MCFICNTNSGVYHSEHCYHTKHMLPGNTLRTDEKSMNYKPCAHCQPDKATILEDYEVVL